MRCVRAGNHTKPWYSDPHGHSCSLLVQTLQTPEHAIPSVSPVSCWMPRTGGSQTPVHKCSLATTWTLSRVPDLQRACMHQPQEFLPNPCHPQLISRVQCHLPAWESGEASHGTAAEVLWPECPVTSSEWKRSSCFPDYPWLCLGLCLCTTQCDHKSVPLSEANCGICMTGLPSQYLQIVLEYSRTNYVRFPNRNKYWTKRNLSFPFFFFMWSPIWTFLLLLLFNCHSNINHCFINLMKPKWKKGEQISYRVLQSRTQCNTCSINRHAVCITHLKQLLMLSI